MATDVAIVGGGMAGLLCAWMLKKSGVDCVVLEADKICCGITANTTAKITSQHGLVYSKLLKRVGPERSRIYWDANEEALGIYRNLSWQYSCGFEDRDHIVFSRNDARVLETEMSALEKLNIPHQWRRDLELPFSTIGGISFPHQAQFHPLRFAAGIAKELQIRENTRVKEFAPQKVVTERGTVKASHIVIATHFPALNKHGGYFLKMYQQRSYVMALENAQKVNAMYLEGKENGLSLRSYEELLLLGGGGHRTGKQGGGWRELESITQSCFPKAREVCRWAAQDCMTLDGIPYIGRYGRLAKGLYVATGFNKWGMTSAMVAARLLRDLILERKNSFADVFSPQRNCLHPQLLKNVGESAMHLVTPTKPRCPHLGCALKWNAQEHSWDCPCHGSRFTQEGKLLDNPAEGDLP